jgi:hypothetical protein
VSFPRPTRRDHDAFCRNEGWREVRNARGSTVGHHVTYELDLPTGDVLRTRISGPVSGDAYGAALWGHMLRDQLKVDEPTFWACVRDKVSPDRGGAAAPAGDALPAELVHLLIHRVGVPQSEVAEMTKGQAVDRLNKYWIDGR